MFVAGLPLAGPYPNEASLSDALLVCATEVTTAEDVDAFAGALEAELGTAGKGDAR